MPDFAEAGAARVDPRVRRTREALRATVRRMAHDGDLASVTVSEVARRSGINRATVYLHYRDREALLLDAMEEAVGEILEAALRCSRELAATGPDADAPPGHLVRLFAHLADNRPLYRGLLGPHGSPACLDRLRELLAEGWRQQLARDGATVDGLPTGLHAAFLAGALHGVIVEWIAAADPTPPADVARGVWVLLRRPATAVAGRADRPTAHR
ncbi:TetR/AcrR family transcriptional regulator [Micromonospora auratinigra]|uniref:Transcriptional regulator, TetR family n=1 Tax=Micromonospora auratinigra TaxID=261654 RepID=A0A1A8ZGC9_9ACTN|nr:TetR/AcrR family transcriptional regulator [Micromonospora auratinigra]SBT42930.1 transcriptional regulator, TetR family [Micromonospora auratinigra]